MASRGDENAELEAASAGGTPVSQVEPEVVNNSVYQPINGSQNHQKEKLQALGFIVSGSLSVAAGRKPTKKLVEHNFGMNIASTTIALVGFVLVSINLAVNKYSLKECPSSQSLDLCICMDVLSNGIMSLMLILTLLELCISISVSAMWCAENACNSREAISSPGNSV
ncbi:membrane-spanning 4-domains subfamily A member 3 isoform X2 [Prionailurus bengalensis]|uniref:membrane-spanning 4-domains subfamily A member 3 isoform X2 n=1 Tax=Prionailurus bengalensis TaxID=37029 RepID=UPI001CAA2C49|nr:membrane-spanning 4-domains subfamily A member 3 isoform X2 [Prionailurus bengalensis]